MTDGMELPNHDKIRTLEENETYKYLGILEADIIKQVEMKDKIRPGKNISGERENYSRQNELKQMDQRTRKLMTMHKALHTRDDVD